MMSHTGQREEALGCVSFGASLPAPQRVGGAHVANRGLQPRNPPWVVATCTAGHKLDEET